MQPPVPHNCPAQKSLCCAPERIFDIMLILQFILAFGVMLFLHEFGHFIVSKAFGIEVEEFGFGLPPRICKLFTWKGTDFTLNLLLSSLLK